MWCRWNHTFQFLTRVCLGLCWCRLGLWRTVVVVIHSLNETDRSEPEDLHVQFFPSTERERGTHLWMFHLTLILKFCVFNLRTHRTLCRGWWGFLGLLGCFKSSSVFSCDWCEMLWSCVVRSPSCLCALFTWLLCNRWRCKDWRIRWWSGL